MPQGSYMITQFLILKDLFMLKLQMKYNTKCRNFILSCEGLNDVIINSGLGAKCLYYLINNKGRSFKPTILRNIMENNVSISFQTKQIYNITTKEEQLLYQTLNQYIEASDMKTIIDINKRKKYLENELEEAKANHDLGKIDQYISEIEFLNNYVKEVLNLNGTFRNLNQNTRKATRSIQRAIELVLQEISEKSEEMYQLLQAHLVVSSNQIKFFDDDFGYVD